MSKVVEVTWYRQRDGLLITDAHARNFRKETNGVLIPVDLVVTTIPKGLTKILPRSGSRARNDAVDCGSLLPLSRGSHAAVEVASGWRS